MAEKKDTGFTVTDRRLFTAEGDLRRDVDEEKEHETARPQAAEQQAAPAAAESETTQDMPAPPTAKEQQAQKDAYQKSSKDLDARVELSGHSARDLEMTFERFVASLYMTAMLQLGLMHEEGGQPRIDLIGARQTIDTIGVLADKTKGNLTSREEGFLQNSLYELRMAYVEVTNSLARPPQPPEGAPKAR
jgi:Domain of unknown function (DUF1844)